jgi:hypothetical protein
VLKPLGLFCTFRSRSRCNPLNGPHSPNKFRSFASDAKWRAAIAIIIVLTFSTQSFALCVCDGQCCLCTPIILDVSGHGFHLTNTAGGVVFDISGTGHPVQISWTALGSDNAFLALPASDGYVHGGKELFGNFTPQPESSQPNGFQALAQYDLTANGGNGDGIIDEHDRIFSSLRLWIDANHDGISEPDELHTLPSMGVNSISLDYELSVRVDRYGNRFRYRSEVNPDDPENGFDVGRVAYDVALISIIKAPQ